jgi:hypothetical protein
LDGIAKSLHAGDTAGFEVGTVHQQCVELYAAIARKEGTATGVKRIVIFHDGDRSFHGIDGCASTRERVPALSECGCNATLVRGDGIIGHGPCATVNDENWFHEVLSRS